MTVTDRPGDSQPNDGPGPDGHHIVTGECFACMVGVATGPESHGDRCVFGRKPDRPGDRGQQQAAEVARIVRGATTEAYAVAALDTALTERETAARAAEKARRDRLVADLRALIRSHAGLSDVVSIHDLRAVLDADKKEQS